MVSEKFREKVAHLKGNYKEELTNKMGLNEGLQLGCLLKKITDKQNPINNILHPSNEGTVLSSL